ncbi:MAG: hypothetical protein ACP5FK_04920 [bacterium]
MNDSIENIVIKFLLLLGLSMLFCSCGILIKSRVISDSDQYINGNHRMLSQDSSWHGILYYQDYQSEMQGDFVIRRISHREFWSMNVSGPMGYSVLKVKLEKDSLITMWKNEQDQWETYRSWEDTTYTPLLPFGDLFFGLCLGYVAGDIINEDQKHIAYCFDEVTYVVEFDQQDFPLKAAVFYQDQEYLYNWVWDQNGHLVSTQIDGAEFMLKLDYWYY